MNEQDYKAIIRLLRKIVERATDMRDNGLVSDGDIRPILHYEELIEELITADYIK